MDVAHPRIVAAHAVLGLSRALPQAPEVDEKLASRLRQEFQNVVLRQPPLGGALSDGPRLILTSTSSQLVVTSTQAELEVRFYGEYASNAQLCLSYLHKKTDAVLNGFAAADIHPAMIGMVLQVQFSCKDGDVSPVEHILRTHLRSEADPASLEDAVARIAVKVRDKYFVSLRVANYESRTIQRPVMAGDFAQQMIVKPWEGSVEDYGISLIIDVNNTLESKTLGTDPEVTEDGVRAVLDLISHSLLSAGPRFVDTGRLDMNLLIAEPA